MKRTILILLIAPALSACVSESASYYIDGRDHALSVRAEQEYFWKDEVSVNMVAARLPDCQRVMPMATLPIAGFDVELFGSGENVYSLRAGTQVWRIQTLTCAQLTEPNPQELGERLGAFKFDAQKKLVFEKAAAPAVPAPPPEPPPAPAAAN